MKRLLLVVVAAVAYLTPALGDDPKPLPFAYKEFDTKDKPEFKEKYDGKVVEFMCFADYKIEGREEGKPRYHLVAAYQVPGPDGKPVTKQADVYVYYTEGEILIANEMKKWVNSKWKCEIPTRGTMKVGDTLVIENAKRVGTIHRVPKGVEKFRVEGFKDK